jgi:hypothetical protein
VQHLFCRYSAKSDETSAAGVIIATGKKTKNKQTQNLHQHIFIFFPSLFFHPLFTYLFIYWNKSFFQFSQMERKHYETNRWPSILFVPNGSNCDPISHPGVCLHRHINQSISEVWNTHEAETKVDNKTKVNSSDKDVKSGHTPQSCKLCFSSDETI